MARLGRMSLGKLILRRLFCCFNSSASLYFGILFVFLCVFMVILNIGPTLHGYISRFSGATIAFRIDDSPCRGKLNISGDCLKQGDDSYSHHGSIQVDLDIAGLIQKVRKKPECMEVAKNPASFWRSQDMHGTKFTAAKDIERMLIASRCGLLYPEFQHRPPIDTLYPFEKFYLSEPAAHTMARVTDERASVVSVVKASQEFYLGETVGIRVDTYDHSGRPNTKGGDEIRVWFTDKNSTMTMAADVQDLNNGSYLATASLLWAGTPKVNVALAYPREYLRALVYIFETMKTFRPIAAQFNNSKANESTPCYHTEVVPGFSPTEFCDFTELNGSPWYCGHPVKKELSCSDFVGTYVVGAVENLPVTDVELNLLKRSCNHPHVRFIPSKIELKVKPGVGNAPLLMQLTPCHQVPAQLTWTQKAPRGFFLSNKWIPSNCYIDEDQFAGCFKNLRVLYLGDSNGRGHYQDIVSRSNCKHILEALTDKWHKPLLCSNTANNFTASWDPHTNPFMSGSYLAELGSLVSSVSAIDKVPSTGRTVIVLNHYFHMTTYHMSAIDYNFRSIKNALVRLFQRNPNVLAIIQGPHVSYKGWPEHYAAGDMLGRYITDIQREIFKDIQDKVLYFSPWDLSIAATNMDFHPAKHNEMHYVILGHICGRI